MKNLHLFIFSENRFHVLCRQTTVYLFIYGKNGSQTASTDATAGGERELAVRRALLGTNAKQLLQLVEHFARTLNIASGTQTYRDVVQIGRASCRERVSLCV